MPLPTEYHALSPELLAEFSAGAGHDLNNPLAAISGRVQLMLREETDAVKRADLAVILSQVRRAQEMIAGLRLTARPPQPEKSRFSLIPFLEKVFQLEELRLHEQRVTWKFRGDSDTTLVADQVQLAVLFQELIRNSLRALGGPGEIRVTWRIITTHLTESQTVSPAVSQVASQIKSQVMLQVESEKELHVETEKMLEIRFMDTGPGILPEIRPFIFDPYYSSYQSGRGLGFGLTKARKIAQLHGGNILLDESARETTFLIMLKMEI
ncbi:MAG: HAMP domain-containing sensor histidine kinase [Planctomycetia bacterium]|nr:HAMP domain-containing sensor histidine kinase [Planctomycetia bacterium]